MKPIKPLLIVAAAVVTLTMTASASEDLLTPKTKEQMDSLRRVPGTSPDMIDRSAQFFGTPKSREVAYSLRKVPSTGPTIDLAHAPRPDLPAKDPRFDMALRNNAVREFEIAALK